MVKHRIAQVAAFALAIVGMQATAVATAETGDGSPTDHCVVGLATGESDPVVDYRCFDSLAESIEYVTDGPGQLRSTETEEATLVGVLYDETGYGSPTLALYGTGGTCSGGANYGFPNLGTYGWNNRPESAQGRNGCAITFYAGYDYTNDTKSCFSNCSTLGTLNNRASSVYFW